MSRIEGSELWSEPLAISDHDSPAVLQDSHDPASGAVIVTISQRTNALVRGLDLILRHHDAGQIIQTSLDFQVHAYLDNASTEMVWLKRAKYLLAYPLARYLRNELPPPPDQAFKPTGSLRAWMKQRLVSFCRRNTHLWYSWFQAKRSALPASDSFVEQTYEDHFKALSSKDCGDDETIAEIFSDATFQNVLAEIRRDLTRNLRHRPLTTFLDNTPSGSACFEQTRGKGGQHGEMLNQIGRVSGDPSPTLLLRMDYYAKSESFHGKIYGQVVEFREKEGRMTWADLSARLHEWNRKKAICCTIQAVLEPFKVRVISKGEALPYYAMKPLQRALHGAMRNMDCFRLIGRPFSPTDCIDLKEKADPTWEWFSIDYSAATDGLSWKYSGKILKFLVGNLDSPDFDLAMQVLGPHNLYYPKKGEDGRPDRYFRGFQRTGQLMGSILSFPILCLANLGVYLKAMKFHQLGWSDEEKLRHVLVNGDDMLYAGPKSLWDTHVSVGEDVGLKMSVGKAFHHSEYLNINSTSVHYNLAQEKSSPWQLDYLNSGLFFGQHKVMNKDGETVDDERAEQFAKAHMSADPSKGFAANLNLILSGALPGRQSSLLQEIMTRFPVDLRKDCSAYLSIRGRKSLFTRNLFLPISQGGMGVRPPCGWRFRISKRDRYVAQTIWSGHSADLAYGYPLPGYELNDLTDSLKSVPWIRPIANDGLPIFTMETSFAIRKNLIQLECCAYAPRKGVPLTLRQRSPSIPPINREANEGFFPLVPRQLLPQYWDHGCMGVMD